MTITTNEVNFSWLRQDKEPDNYYKWFTYYRDMTGTRQIKKVIDVLKEKEPYLEKTPSYEQLRKASSKWYWKRRTVDYDNYMYIQLLESKKQMLITYEEESTNLAKKIYEQVDKEVNNIIENEELTPDKKLKAYKVAQDLNISLLESIEHVANTEIHEVSYIDVAAARKQDIITALVNATDGIITPEQLNEQIEEYTNEEIEEIINKEKAKRNVQHNRGAFDSEYIRFDGEKHELINSPMVFNHVNGV